MLHPADDPACHAIIVHPPGGIVGGDRLEISALAEAGSHALADDSRRHTLSIADTKLMLLMGRLMAT